MEFRDDVITIFINAHSTALSETVGVVIILLWCGVIASKWGALGA